MSMNFYRRYREVQRRSKSGGRRRAVLASLPALIFAAACAFSALSLSLQTSGLEAERDALESYLTDPENVAKSDEAARLSDENASLSSKISSDKYLSDAIASYPVPDSEVRGGITEYGEECGVSVEFTSYTASSGSLSFNASSEVADNIWNFVKTLTASDILAKVDYTGYEYSSRDGVYKVLISCTLSESAGK